MTKHLHFISRPLRRYIQAQISLNGASRQRLIFKSGLWKLDPITHIAQIQGMALFNHSFFDELDKKSIKDPESQWKIYSKLVLDRQFIIEVCEHSQLLDAFRLDKANDRDKGEICFTALCIVLWDMHCQKETKQAKQIIRRFIEHYIAQLFPEKRNIELTQDEIIKAISKLLYQQWKVKPEIKESFKTTKESVEFSLIARTTDYHPLVLLTLKGKRLKPTRKKCYKALLALLKDQFATIHELIPKTAKKKFKIKPLEITN